ncbi:MAG: D-alanyl-D-alanine carboxypeptidase, partial [Prochlorococcus sp. MED630]|nr:D-alanyl-D-alanine carboxypeptidase [Prochlorococcus sp. MED630]
MKKKLSLYIGLIIISINTANGNLFSIYSYVRQRININTIIPEERKICYGLQKKIEDYIDNFNSKISV